MRMEENQENQNWGTEGAPINRLLVIGAVALLVLAGIAFGYGYRQSNAVGHLTAQQSVANDTISQLQSQLGTVNGKLNDMVAAQQAQQQAAEEQKAAARSGKRGGPADTRYKQLKAQLEDQGKQLKDT